MSNLTLDVLQARLHDVRQADDAQLQHDAEVAAPGDFQLRVPHVPEHHSRLVRRSYCTAFLPGHFA